MLAFGVLVALGLSDIPRVYDVENTGSQLAKPVMPEPDQLPVIRELPDPLEGVASFADWQKRRSDIAHMIQHYGIGEKPAVEPSQVKARMEGDSALVVDVTVNGQTLTLRSVITYPKTGQPPYALMIGTIPSGVRIMTGESTISIACIPIWSVMVPIANGLGV